MNLVEELKLAKQSISKYELQHRIIRIDFETVEESSIGYPYISLVDTSLKGIQGFEKYAEMTCILEWEQDPVVLEWSMDYEDTPMYFQDAGLSRELAEELIQLLCELGRKLMDFWIADQSSFVKQMKQGNLQKGYIVYEPS